MQNRAPQTEDKYVVRFPHGMRDRIKAAAALNNRSMNAEIIATLEAKYPGPDPEVQDLLSRIADIEMTLNYEPDQSDLEAAVMDLQNLRTDFAALLQKYLDAEAND